MPGAVSVPPGPATGGGAYAEHAPPSALAPHVECFWSRATTPGVPRPRAHRVTPDGCVDIILTFATSTRPPDVEAAAPDTAFAVGAMTRPVVFSDSTSAGYLGVRFRPGMAGVLFGMPASEMTDERVALGDIWADSDAVCDALARAPDTAARIRTISAAVARRLLAARDWPPPAVVAASERIVAVRGKVSIARLAAEIGVTRQHLARSFAQHVGLSPKQLARIVRARSVVDRVRRDGDVDWSALALDAGYYDQSHLIGELKELTGLPPSGWVATRA